MLLEIAVVSTSGDDPRDETRQKEFTPGRASQLLRNAKKDLAEFDPESFARLFRPRRRRRRKKPAPTAP